MGHEYSWYAAQKSVPTVLLQHYTSVPCYATDFSSHAFHKAHFIPNAFQKQQEQSGMSLKINERVRGICFQSLICDILKQVNVGGGGQIDTGEQTKVSVKEGKKAMSNRWTLKEMEKQI